MSPTKRLLIWLQALFGRPGALVLEGDRLVAHGAAWSAFPRFARAARRGLPEAQRRVGESYLSGQGVPASLAEALRWLNRAAEAGDASAQTQLASLALQGARAPRLAACSSLTRRKSRISSAPNVGVGGQQRPVRLTERRCLASS